MSARDNRGDSRLAKIVIGIDPDSIKHGFAEYDNGVLIDLDEKQLADLIYRLCATHQDHDLLVSIEDVMANDYIYTRNQKQSKRVQTKVGVSLGRCQQSQVELMRMLEYYGIPYVLHKPQAGNWADKRALFERITGWTKRSNKDTRSAAFFGYLGLR
jgi:hypothetical protein